MKKPLRSGREQEPPPPENFGETLNALYVRSRLSFDALARRGGYAGATSIHRFFDPKYMAGRWPDAEFIARMALAFDGSGQPPISKQEILRMMPPGPHVIISPVAVLSIPVVPWAKLALGAGMLKLAERATEVEVPDLPGGASYIAVEIEDRHCERVAGPGATVVVDLDDQALIDQKIYAIVANGRPMVMQWRTVPMRWQSMGEAETIFLEQGGYDVRLVGRVIRSLKEW